jgi:hypothetical protein
MGLRGHRRRDGGWIDGRQRLGFQRGSRLYASAETQNAQIGRAADITGRRQEVIERAASYHNQALRAAGGSGELIPIVSDQADLESLKRLVVEIGSKVRPMLLAVDQFTCCAGGMLALVRSDCLAGERLILTGSLFVNAGAVRKFVPFLHLRGDAAAISQAMLEDSPQNWSDLALSVFAPIVRRGQRRAG